MKKLILFGIFLAIPALAASTFTTNFSLEKPADDDTSWGAAIRDSFDLIDTQMGTQQTSLNNHLNNLVSVHAASSISATAGALLCPSSTTVQAFLNCVDAAVGPVLTGGSVTIASAQTITGAKTFSALLTASGGLTLTGFGAGVLHSDGSGSITSSTIVNADVAAGAAIARTKLAAGTASHVLINDGSGVISSEAQLATTRGGSGVSNGGTLTWGSNNITLSTGGVTSLTLPASGTLATLAGTETLTNKTLSGNTASNFLNGAATITMPAATGTLATLAGSEVLTNKTVSRASNTMSGFTAAAVPTADGSGVLGAGVAPGSAGEVLTSTGSAWASSEILMSVSSKTADYTLVSTDDLILVDSSGGAFTLTLPAAASNTGKVFMIKKTDSTFATANAVTVDGNASETIDGSLTRTLNTQHEEYSIVSDGTNWRILTHKTSTPWASYSASTVGLGTTVSNEAEWRRVGANLETRGVIQVGTPTATEARIGLPTGVATFTTTITSANVLIGGGDRANTSPAHFEFTSNTGDTFIVPMVGRAKLNGNVAFQTNETFTWLVSVPIEGWTD